MKALLVWYVHRAAACAPLVVRVLISMITVAFRPTRGLLQWCGECSLTIQ
jgi:hypothetical protein